MGLDKSRRVAKLCAAGTALVLAGVLSACGGSGSGDGSKATVRFASMLPPKDAISQTIDAWMTEVSKDSSVEFQHQYAGALIPGAEMFSGVSDGRATGGYVVPAYHPKELALNNIASVPVPFDSETRARALNELLQKNETVKAEFTKAGITPLFVTLVASPWGLATKKAVTSVDQLKGMRIRLLPGVAAPYEKLGAEAVFLSNEEIYESLERGIIDGVVQPFDAWNGTGVFEVAPNMTIHGIGAFGAGIVTMNTERFEALPQAVRDAMVTDAGESFATSVGIFKTEEAATCEKVKAAGAKVTSLPDAEIAKFEAAIGTSLVDVWFKSGKDAGYSQDEMQAVWDEYNGYLEQFAPESTYESGMEACAGS